MGLDGQDSHRDGHQAAQYDHEDIEKLSILFSTHVALLNTAYGLNAARDYNRRRRRLSTTGSSTHGRCAAI